MTKNLRESWPPVNPPDDFHPNHSFMDIQSLTILISVAGAMLSTSVGCIAPALAQGRAVSTALSALAQQPDAAPTITRTLFVGLAMIESLAIYAFVVSMILLFANPFWNHVVEVSASH